MHWIFLYRYVTNHINIEENVTIKQAQNIKYLGVNLNKRDINSKDIVNKICKGKQIIGCLNSLWWDKNISLDTKKRLGKAIVESVACYGCEVWLLKTKEQRKLLALEMDYLRRSAYPGYKTISNTALGAKC